ncbi:DUF2304 domain-containing protein [Georgenia satyanarayanai]|uniref:DUF2304 domain-containing protein n=1 Tax=Georgenia satyanarayanai TaxID=860221 RepID=UPI00203F15D1|nr:DUF2304 domain-containing protein [Georgenia satyanarayanai]MCM3661102.1 DUF2304 domain-containing protein [Georgenia satyanarayanai]
MSEQIVIQVLLLAGVSVVAVLLTRTTANARHQAIRRILLVGFVAVAAGSVMFPDWLSWLARRVGVGRGADLLLYALVIAFLSYIATSYRRLSELERRITVLAREVALTRSRIEDVQGPPNRLG